MARQPARLPDWLFSGAGKRRALNTLFLELEPRTWTRGELADAIGQHRKARTDLYLEPLVQAGVLRRTGASYSIVSGHPLIEPLRSLLVVLQALPDEELDR